MVGGTIKPNKQVNKSSVSPTPSWDHVTSRGPAPKVTHKMCAKVVAHSRVATAAAAAKPRYFFFVLFLFVFFFFYRRALSRATKHNRSGSAEGHSGTGVKQLRVSQLHSLRGSGRVKSTRIRVDRAVSGPSEEKANYGSRLREPPPAATGSSAPTITRNN